MTGETVMRLLQTETLKRKYLRLKKTIGGYSDKTVNLYKLYLNIIEVDDIQILEVVEYALYSSIEREVEAFVFKNVR